MGSMPRLKLGRLETHGLVNSIRLLVGAAILIGLAGFTVASLGRVLPRSALNGMLRLWARVTIWFLDLDIDVDGAENVDVANQYMVVALHEGFVDPLALSLLGLDLRFVVRDELFSWRLLGPALRGTGQIQVSPEARLRGLRALLEACNEAVRSGESLMIFPQGTVLGLETAFQPGAFHLADRLGISVLPVVLTGSHQVWGHPFDNEVHFGQKMSMQIMPPIPPGTAEDAMRQLEIVMKARALEPDRAPARRFIPERDGYWDGYSFQIDPAYPDLRREIETHRRSVANSRIASSEPRREGFQRAPSKRDFS